MENQRIKDFLEKVEKLGLRFPVATIARETGYSKGMVSRLLKGEEEPSEFFLLKFNEAFMKERIITEDDVKLRDSNSPGITADAKSIDMLLQILKQQSDTIASQQETIKLLATRLPAIA